LLVEAGTIVIAGLPYGEINKLTSNLLLFKEMADQVRHDGRFERN
jgi:hypothetical protein